MSELSAYNNDNWYYRRNGELVGPYQKNQILQMVFSGTLAKDSYICNSDAKESLYPIYKILSLGEELPPPLPLLQHQQHVTPELPPLKTSYRQSTLQLAAFLKLGTPHPFRRLFARCTDSILFLVVIVFTAVIILGGLEPFLERRLLSFMEVKDPRNYGEDGIRFMVLVTFLIPFGMAAPIGFTGTSFGKWLFGVKVLDKNDRPIGYVSALKRELLLWLYGLGLGLPMLWVITLPVQGWILQTRRITPWDRKMGTTVKYRAFGISQLVLSCTGLLLLSGLIYLLRNP